MPEQGWFLHDVCDHGYGPGRPRLSDKEMLNVGFVWVDIITTRQYLLNLRSGKFEKVRSENQFETLPSSKMPAAMEWTEDTDGHPRASASECRL